MFSGNPKTTKYNDEPLKNKRIQNIRLQSLQQYSLFVVDRGDVNDDVKLQVSKSYQSKFNQYLISLAWKLVSSTTLTIYL